MGIYIFNWKTLRKMLLADMKSTESSHDFGKDIIPTLLAEGKMSLLTNIKATGKTLERSTLYGKQIWILLSKNNELDLNDSTWKIYTEDVTSITAVYRR